MSATNTPCIVIGQDQELVLMEYDHTPGLDDRSIQTRMIVNVGTSGHCDHQRQSVEEAIKAVQDFNIAITLAATAVANSALSNLDLYLWEPPNEVHLTNGPKSKGGKRKRNPDRWR